VHNLTDIVKQQYQYCSRFINSLPHCACLARFYSPGYQQPEASTARNAGGQFLSNQCQWAPCTNPSLHLVATDVTAKPGCSGPVCQALQNVVDSGGVNTQNVSRFCSSAILGK
jgi:5-methylcytosine-specific restriction endonuclease McrA